MEVSVLSIGGVETQRQPELYYLFMWVCLIVNTILGHVSVAWSDW